MGYTAVIIDSNGSYRKSLASILRSQFKFEVIYTCATSSESIGVVRQAKQVNLLFCDCNVSDHSGLNFLSELKAIKSCTQAHFILLANTSSREFLQEASDFGVSGLLLKPFTIKTVTENVKKLIGKTKGKS